MTVCRSIRAFAGLSVLGSVLLWNSELMVVADTEAPPNDASLEQDGENEELGDFDSGGNIHGAGEPIVAGDGDDETFLPGDLAAYDVAPCGGNGIINLDDILAELGAFSAAYSCTCPGGGGGQWATSGNNIYNTNTGNVGIGTTLPGVRLQVEGGTDADAVIGGGYIQAGPTTGANLVIDNNEIMARNNGAIAGMALQGNGGDLGIHTTGPITPGSQIIFKDSGDVGIGTTTPETRLHIEGGTDVGPASGGYFVMGDTAAANIAMDNNEIIARNAGATSTLFLQGDGGYVAIGQNTFNSRLGINLFSPSHPIHVGSNSGNGNGAHLTAGGVWTNGSDRNSKEGFERLDKQEILRKVTELPVTRWKYKAEQDAVRHIGPMAQDFSAAFGTGQDDRYIGTIDADGVALAAIQGLYDVVQEKDCQIADLVERDQAKDRRVGELEERLARMETLLSQSPLNEEKP